MTPVECRSICVNRLYEWAKRMASEHSTPVLALGVGHDHRGGQLTVHATEDLPDEAIRGFVTHLYAELVQKPEIEAARVDGPALLKFMTEPELNEHLTKQLHFIKSCQTPDTTGSMLVSSATMASRSTARRSTPKPLRKRCASWPIASNGGRR